ncbi:MAG: hypothetical protein ACHQQ3_08660 [Gemmatimonadales bacterium]
MPAPSTVRVRSAVRIAPTLTTMSEMYRLSPEGGPASPRFRAYVSRVEHEWGLVQYNPMAGTAAQETVEALLALGAESLALEAAATVAAACEYYDPITLAISVHSKGMWTDRVATEVQERASDAGYRSGFGIVSLWSREKVTADDIRRESAAEAARVMWHALHGREIVLASVLAREGLAYALAAALIGVVDPYGTLSVPDRTAVSGAMDVLGKSAELADIAGVLFGDDTATTMGWTPLGVPQNAGYRWAIDCAARRVAADGATRALRTRPALTTVPG